MSAVNIEYICKNKYLEIYLKKTKIPPIALWYFRVFVYIIFFVVLFLRGSVYHLIPDGAGRSIPDLQPEPVLWTPFAWYSFTQNIWNESIFPLFIPVVELLYLFFFYHLFIKSLMQLQTTQQKFAKPLKISCVRKHLIKVHFLLTIAYICNLAHLLTTCL